MIRKHILLAALVCAVAQGAQACDDLVALECSASRGRMLPDCTCKRPFSKLAARIIGYVGFVLVGLFWLA